MIASRIDNLYVHLTWSNPVASVYAHYCAAQDGKPEPEAEDSFDYAAKEEDAGMNRVEYAQIVYHVQSATGPQGASSSRGRERGNWRDRPIDSAAPPLFPHQARRRPPTSWAVGPVIPGRN